MKNKANIAIYSILILVIIYFGIFQNNWSYKNIFYGPQYSELGEEKEVSALSFDVAGITPEIRNNFINVYYPKLLLYLAQNKLIKEDMNFYGGIIPVEISIVDNEVFLNSFYRSSGREMVHFAMMAKPNSSMPYDYLADIPDLGIKSLYVGDGVRVAEATWMVYLIQTMNKLNIIDFTLK